MLKTYPVGKWALVSVAHTDEDYNAYYSKNVATGPIIHTVFTLVVFATWSYKTSKPSLSIKRQ